MRNSEFRFYCFRKEFIMWKIALIAWIIFAILKWVYGIMIDAMSVEEKIACKLSNEIPMRLIVVGGITLIEFITTIVMTVITIIKW